MDDRSVTAGDVNQSVIITGDGNRVSLTFGDSGVVLPLRRAQFPPPSRRQRVAPTDERPRDLDILLPEAGKLPLVGREDLLGELRAWLDDEPDISVHAVIGRAGTGKTRLAIELCKAVDSDPGADGPWLAGFISAGDLAAVVETLAVRTFSWERLTLLVLDYAAQCHRALARWLDRLAYQKLDTKLRILLLEREAPEDFGWWHELTRPATNTEQARVGLFYALRPRLLPDLTDVEERRRLLTAALQAARAFHPKVSYVEDVPGPGVDPAFDSRLAGPQFGNPLSLAMAGVIAAERGLKAGLVLHRLDAALRLGRRELERLVNLAESRGIDADAMRYVIGFNGLTGGLRLADLRQILADELAASQRAANLDALLPLLDQELPPHGNIDRGVQDARLATIQPDLVGEAVIIQAFTGSPTQEAEAPSIVRRAYALGQSAAAQVLVRLVQDYAYALEDHLALADEKAAGRRVMDWFLALVGEIKDPEQLVLLVGALPQNTIILREIAAELTGRIVDMLRVFHFFFGRETGHSNLKTRGAAARWTSDLANRLSDLGRYEEALTAAEEAVRLHRDLVATRPDLFTPGLAVSLGGLANQLSTLGRREEAVLSAEEAVRLFRNLAVVLPDAFTPGLAMSLNNSATMLGDLGRHDEAVALAEEAVRLYRGLAGARPDAFTPDLAGSLNTFANRLSALGRREKALEAAEESVGLYRDLAAARPDAFTPGLAGSLTNVAITLGDLGRREAALEAAEEAVRLWRDLAAIRPDAFTPELASSLNNLANRLGALGRHEGALEVAEESVGLYRDLAATRPDAFTPDLARSTDTLGYRLSALGRREAALAAAEEAVRLWRDLAATRPDAFTPGLVNAINNLASRRGDMGQHEAALALAGEAVQHYRGLATSNPDAFIPHLAGSLTNLAVRLKVMDRHEEAIKPAEEAVQLNRNLAAANPDAFTPDLADSLSNLANRLGAVRRYEQALPLADEAARIHRNLAAVHPDAFRPALARSLNNLANRLGDLGRREAALAAAEEAVRLWRDLAAANPDAFKPQLVNMINNYARRLTDMGQHAAAREAAEEADRLRRDLVASRPNALPGQAMSWSPM